MAFNKMNENSVFNFPVYCSIELTSLANPLIYLSVFNIAIAIIVIVGNTVILIALRKETSLHLPSKVLIRTLAATDLCIGIVEFFFVAYWMSLVNSRMQLCHVTLVIHVVAGTILFVVSLLTITAISVDRLLALLLGLRYRQVVTIKRVYAVLIAVGVYPGFGVAIGFYNREAYQIFASTTVAGCMITSVYCYSKIFYRLHHHRTQVRSNDQANDAVLANMMRYRKSVSSAIWLQFVFVFCYFPYFAVSPFVYQGRDKGRSLKVLFLALYATTTFMFFNSMLNPMLYCWKIKEVRRVVKDTLKQIPCSLH